MRREGKVRTGVDVAAADYVDLVLITLCECSVQSQ
jgi:hypothetical protein